jgi:hypothetical protein
MSTYGNFLGMYATHIVEVKVIRRNPIVGRGPTRRFLCTNSKLLLNSIAGKTVFHFKPPTQRPPYNAQAKNLLTVYDLLMQGYRNVNLDTDQVLAAIPVRNEQEIAQFWDYFNTNLSKWSSSNKEMFMNM